MGISTTSVRNNLTLRAMFCMAEGTPQASHQRLIDMYKIKSGQYHLYHLSINCLPQ